MRAFFYTIAIFIALGISHVHAQSIVVAELFTAQGCGYSAEAEKTFERFASKPDQTLILLSCHVTKFDNEFFQDPFSEELCDERHQMYERFSSSLDAAGIPTIVVNGRYTDRAANTTLVESSVAMARSLDQIAPLQVTIRDEHLDLVFPEIRTDKNLAVWLMGYKKNHLLKVPKDVQEISGMEPERLFTHPVNHIKKLFLWDGRYVTLSVPLSDMPDADGFVVVAQNKSEPGIIAAGKDER